MEPTLLSLPSAAAALAVSFLLGAVPFGLVLTRLLRGTDLRTIGSGNIGATNAMRALGKPLGVVVFLLDFAKGWAPAALLAPALGEGDAFGLAVACGGTAVLGHCFSPFLGFKGGKGVATACGAVVALDPLAFLIGGAAWIAALALTRYVGLASILMVAGFAVAAGLRSSPGRRELFVGTLLLTLLILVRHRSNIRRMLAGKEPRVGSPDESGTEARA